MSRLKNKLTAKSVQSKKAPGYYADGGNLYLRVSATLSKTWAFYYKQNGKRSEMGLGSLDDVSLEQAREKAHDYKRALAQGINPLDEKRRLNQEKLNVAKKSMTFEMCAAAFIQKHEHELKNPKHIQQWTNTLVQYAYPVIGELPVEIIDTGLIIKCLEPIWITKNETASRVRGRIEQVLSWATVSGYRTGENPARWRGHLDKLLSKPSKTQTVKHHAALPYIEIAAFMGLLRRQEGVAARCLEFTILTAARTGEAIGATWSEIDLASKVWTIPKERMKADNEHRVPLSDDCMALITNMQNFRVNDYLFPGQRNGLSNMAMLKLLARMDRKDLTVHGFRSTFRDWAAETTNYPNEVLEKCLSHTIKNEAEAAYRRGDLLEKRVNVMSDWAVYCNG